MRNKLILFLMLAFLGSTGFLRADELTVHDGSGTSSYVPVYGFYADSYLKCEMVFPAEELSDMENGTISSLTFYATSPASEAWTGTFQVFVTEVASATISDFAGPGTVVYEGTLNGTQPQMTITFNQPYAYNGGNLLVGVYCTTTGNYKSVTWGGETVEGASVQGYSYSSLSAISATQRNFLPKTTFTYTPGSGPTPPTPPTPTGDFSITPNDAFALGDRPTNGWMEPFTVRLYNQGADVLISASMSNTSGEEPFIMSEEIDSYLLATGEALEFEVEWNANAAEADYNEEFTLFYAENNRDIITIPVTGYLYTAPAADIVETAENITLSYTSGEASFSVTPTDLHANYMLQGMTEMKTDAVYSMNLANDSEVFLETDDTEAIIAVYNKVNDFHPTAGVEPVVMTTTGAFEDEEILLAGQYYIIVASNDFTELTGVITQIPAPEELTYIAPADQATGLEGNIVLTWEGGDNATQYQVLFGTSPTNTPVALDWTMVDENYGTFDVTDFVSPNTQYFWQIKVKNSNGIVTGPRWGFTTALITPTQVTATPEEIFVDESTLIKWRLAGAGGFTGNITVADGTSTNSSVPVYGLWMDYYTRSEMIYPAEMLEEMNGGDITSMVFYISSAASGPWSGNQYHVYMMEVDNTTLSSYYTSANATIVYTGGLDGQGTTMNIVFDQPYTYGGGNLLVGIEEFVKGTWKSCSFYGMEATGASASGYNSSALASVTFNQQNFLPKVTFHCGDERNINLAKGDRTFQGFNVYYGDVKANTELITENKYLLSNLPYNVTPGHDVTVTAVYNEGESEKSAPVVVKVSGYGTLTGTVTEYISGQPMSGVAVAFNGMDEFGNPVAFNGTTNANGVYTINNVKAGIYNIGKASKEGFEDSYMENTATLEYQGTTTVDFVLHETYNPVYKVFAQELDPSTAKVTWSLHDFVNPTPGGNTPGGGSASTFSEGFEGGLPQGWTVIDANNDGWTWCLTSDIPSTWTYYASMTLDWYRTGSNAICSGSYINGVGALNPNDYLVSPQLTLVNGSTFSFWAAATDASYPADHFGVFVSDNGTSDWTMVNEWTLTAKSAGPDGGRASRDGEGAKLGTWYNYSVDLSAYAGQKYIALRHFNCTDMYIMCVDDMELTVGSKGNRAVQDYAIFRKAILKENDLVPADSVFFGYVSAPDTLYADFDWNNVEPGLYQYGVAACYPTYQPFNRNRANVTIDFETGDLSQFNFDNSGSSYPWTVVTGGNPGYCMKSSNGGVASSTSAISATFVFPTDGTVSFSALCQGEGTSTFWDKCIFEIDGDQQFANGANVSGWNDYSYDVAAGEHTFTWKYTKDSSVNPTGDCMMVDNIVFEYVGAEATNDDPRTPITWSNVLPKNMGAYVSVKAIIPVGTAEGAVVRFHNTFESVSDVEATFDETGIVEFPEFRKGEYELTVDLEGYTSNYSNTPVSVWADSTEYTVIFEEIFKPIDALAVSQTGFARWSDILPHEERVAERYVVTLDGSLYTETTDNYLQFEGLTDGQTYTAAVAVIYSTGMSPYLQKTFTYVECIDENPVTDLAASNEDMDVTLTWTNGSNPPTPPTPPTPGNTFDFDDGTMMGWTSIDADGDNYGWVAGNAVGGVYLVAGASLAGSGHNSSEGLVCSGSYSNYTGAALSPNNYLVCPAKGQYSSISFWACGQDASYVAEHFGVAVSTTTASASAFTTVQEWTMTGKGEGAMSIGRDGQNRVQGNWHEYTVDLSAYAGQEIWVAIRHFGCTDMFILDVDDITLTPAAKSLEDGVIGNAGQGLGSTNANVTDDGNWYYYDNGINDDAIGLTSGGGFYWGIMFPAGTVEGEVVTKVSYFDYAAHNGTVSIYQGGTSAPQTLLHSQPYTVNGTSQYVEFEMTEPVEIDNTQPIWVVMHNNNGQYVAAIDAGPGVTNGSCISTDGSTWYTTVSAASGGALDGNWNLRAYIETGGSAPTGASVVTPNKYNIFVDGELVGVAGANATSFTWTCPDYAEHLYEVVWIDSNYNFYCPASIRYRIDPDYVGENSVINAIYPNPTSGDLYVKANDMVRISVVNMLGQVVYDMAVEGDETVINMGQFEAGLYMVNVITKNGSSVERIVVK